MCLNSYNGLSQIKCKVEHYSTENGLSHDAVTTVFKDGNGMMWFGTWAGLNRFDGQNFVSFKSTAGDNSALKSDRIDQIVEDQSNHLWIKGYDDQIYRFDKGRESFTPLAKIANVNQDGVVKFSRILSSEGGSLWLKSLNNGLYFINETNAGKSTFLNFSATSRGASRIPSNFVNFFKKDSFGNIWIGTDKGLCKLSGNRRKGFNAQTGLHLSSIKENFSTVCETPGKMYFTTAEGSLIVFDQLTQSVFTKNISSVTITNAFKSSKKQVIYYTTLAGTIITLKLADLSTTHDDWEKKIKLGNIFEDSRGQLWLEPGDEGVVKFDPLRHQFTAYSQKIDPGSKDKWAYYKIFEDKEGLIWVMMKGGGFGYYDEKKDLIQYFFNEPGSRNRKFSNLVSTAFDDGNGIMWLSTDERGLEKIIFQQNHFQRHLLQDPGTFRSNNDVRGILYDTHGRLWLGVKDGNLYVYKNGIRLPLPFLNMPKGGMGMVYTIHQDKTGAIWFGTKSNGIYLATPAGIGNLQYQLSHYEEDNSRPDGLSSNEIYAITEDKSGRIWIGTFDKGLNLAEKISGQYHFIHSGKAFHLYPKAGFQKIRHMTSDANGRLWLGTTDGLLVLNVSAANVITAAANYVKIPGDRSSLGKNDIQFVFHDGDGKIWLGTSGGGLSQVVGNNPFKSLKFKNFTIKDGLPNDYILSIIEDIGHNFWIATSKGLSKFVRKQLIFRNFDSGDGLPQGGFSEASCTKGDDGNLYFGTIKGFISFRPTEITDAPIRGKMIFTNLQVNNHDITSYDANSILQKSIDYTSTLQLRHDQNIISLDYTVLDYRTNDKQKFIYKLNGFDKEWQINKNQRRATYTNLPPGKYVLEVKAINKELYTKQPYKSLSIIIASPPWRTWWAYLIYLAILGVIFELIRRTSITMLSLRHKISVEQKLAALKLSFFTNVSHELRTPLTLIVNPIDAILKKENLSEEGRQHISIVRKNAGRMVRFVNQLLDLRKLQSGKATLNISEVDLIAFVKGIVEYFDDIAKEKNVMINVTSNSPAITAYIDADKFEIVIYNVISNALKFSPQNRTVTISLALNEDRQMISMVISDEGRGVDQASLSHIFELYYEGEENLQNGVKGTGIGLALSKELVQLHKGSITAINNEHGGFSVIINIPYTVAISGQCTIEKTDFETNQRTDESDIHQASIQKSNPVNEIAANTPLVLLVEDNYDLRKFLAIQLGEHFRVELAEDGSEGLQMATKLLPDLIISDVMMPKMDGIQMLVKLKNEFSTCHIPVVLLSAKSSIESQIEGLQYGADLYLTKPFQNDFLIASVKNLISQRKRLFDVLVKDKKTIELKPSEIVITSKDEIFLKDVIKVVEEQMVHSEFNIDAMAEKIEMSRTTFYRKFKSLTNLTPVEFVRDMRLQRARQLLDSGETNISIVAYAVGFNNAKYFSTCFKDKYSLSPSDYLKKQ